MNRKITDRTLRRLMLIAVAALLSLPPLGLCGCGTLHTHWDMDRDFNFDNGAVYSGHHKPPKPPKKPPKPKKKKHHHHDDD